MFLLIIGIKTVNTISPAQRFALEKVFPTRYVPKTVLVQDICDRI